MRLLLFVLSLTVSSAVFAARPISGTVARGTKSVYLSIESRECYRYEIKALNDEAMKHMRRLSDGDTISGTGTFLNNICVVEVESIEYVGLKNLLGYWYSDTGIITVKDFSLLSFYPINISDLKTGEAERTGDPITYRYSVTPSNGREWVVFLSDKESTMFATIELNRRKAVMKLYDSETGVLTRTLRLSKWGNLKP